MSLLQTLQFITRHPLTKYRPLAAVARFALWQAESRIRRDVTFNWVDGAKLIARRGMTGATGNIYCGLQEFSDMGFLLHFLREGDLFVDVGANIGSYTVLASAVCGAETMAIEPDPSTMAFLKKNIFANRLDDKVSTVEAAVGRYQGIASITVGRETVSQVSRPGEKNVRKVRVLRLDDLLVGKSPAFMKIDVKGYEAEVLRGASDTLRNSSLLAVDTGCRDAAVVSVLMAAGFTEYAYQPFSRSLTNRAGGFGNALFIRDVGAVLRRINTAKRRRVLHKII